VEAGAAVEVVAEGREGELGVVSDVDEELPQAVIARHAAHSKTGIRFIFPAFVAVPNEVARSVQ
jgi:hypothetical protein